MNTFFFDDVQYPEGLFGGKDFFNPIIYSTEEREVGVWINNKPLYQKTLVFENYSSSDYKDVSALNIEEVVASWGEHKQVNGDYSLSFPYYENSNWYSLMTFDKTNERYYVYCSSNMANSYPYLYVTIQYTKTTDTAGSGSYNTLGVPNVHYTTDEQVIGTWFGETLYEKIINFDYNDIQSSTSSGCEIYINVPDIKDTKDSVILFEGGTIQFPYFVSTSIFIGGFTQTETDTFHISLRYSSSVYSELNAYLTDCRVKLQYTKTS